MATRAIFFDLFDTLVQVTERTGAYARLLERMRQDGELTPEEVLGLKKRLRSFFLSTRTTCDVVGSLLDSRYFEDTPYFQALVEDMPKRVRADLKAAAEKEVESVVPFDQAREVLERLSRRFKLVLVSNLASPFKEPFYGLGLAEHFEAAVFSCDAGACKPDPIIFERALAVCSIKDSARILMVGDKDRTDGEGARAAGIHYFRSTGKPSFLKELEQFI